MNKVTFSAAADDDIIQALKYSFDHFGTESRLRYEVLIARALRNLNAPSRPLGCKHRPDLGENIFVYHLRHSRIHSVPSSVSVHNPRHLFILRIVDEKIRVVRFLHDAMKIEVTFHS